MMARLYVRLDDKTTKFVSSRVHNFSHLESIEVYTEGDNVNLAEVFIAMQNSNEALPGEKDPSAVKSYFKAVYPTMDFDRVYTSDMKKMVKWFDALKKNNIEIKVSEEAPEEEEEGNEEKPDPNKQPEEKPKVEEPVVTPAVEAAPKKAKAAKAKKEDVDAEEDETNSAPKAANKKAVKK